MSAFTDPFPEVDCDLIPVLEDLSQLYSWLERLLDRVQ
jgi:hypothetical protein